MQRIVRNRSARVFGVGVFDAGVVGAGMLGAVAIGALVLGAVGCGARDPEAGRPASAHVAEPVPSSQAGLSAEGLIAATPGSEPGPAAPKAPIENLIAVVDHRLYSGGEPKDDAAFDALAAMGVKTIVSVDGATPNVEAARARGMRYVHAPIGYDGVPAEAQAVLKAALASSGDPVFVHCHHGRHRGPAAAAVALAIETGAGPEERAALLRQAGTSPDYPGLWEDVAACAPAQIDATGVALVEVARVEDFAGHMAVLDRHWDNLKASRKAGWSVPPDSPDVVPVREATMAWESLRESGRFVPEAHGGDAAFAEMLASSETAAAALKAALEAGDTAAAEAAFVVAAESCKKCHVAYRD